MGHFVAILGHLRAILGHLGAVLRPCWGILGPSWAILGVSWATLGHLGTKSFQDTSRMAGTVAGRRHLGRFSITFWGLKLVTFWLFLGSCFRHVFGHFLENFWANFGDPFWDQMGLRGAKIGSKRPLKSFKVATTYICNNLKKP